jgi:hypothetical protein
MIVLYHIAFCLQEHHIFICRQSYSTPRRRSLLHAMLSSSMQRCQDWASSALQSTSLHPHQLPAQLQHYQVLAFHPYDSFCFLSASLSIVMAPALHNHDCRPLLLHGVPALTLNPAPPREMHVNDSVTCSQAGRPSTTVSSKLPAVQNVVQHETLTIGTLPSARNP